MARNDLMKEQLVKALESSLKKNNEEVEYATTFWDNRQPNTFITVARIPETNIIKVRVPGKAGPRYFEIRLHETY